MRGSRAALPVALGISILPARLSAGSGVPDCAGMKWSLIKFLLKTVGSAAAASFRFFRGQIGDDFLEARIAAEIVPILFKLK